MYCTDRKWPRSAIYDDENQQIDDVMQPPQPSLLIKYAAFRFVTQIFDLVASLHPDKSQSGPRNLLGNAAPALLFPWQQKTFLFWKLTSKWLFYSMVKPPASPCYSPNKQFQATSRNERDSFQYGDTLCGSHGAHTPLDRFYGELKAATKIYRPSHSCDS